MTPARLYLHNISTLFQRPLRRIAVGVVFGFAVGIGLLSILQREDVSVSVILITGAFAGVFAEIFVEFAENAITARHQLEPLNRTLGTVATENTWIYISAWRRDLDDLDHSRLFRNDPDRVNQPSIIGSPYVYGRGDAIALSLIYKAVEKATRGKTQIIVEDSEHILDQWGRSAICIGAHNSKTREVLDKFTNTYFRFELNYSIIINANSKPIVNRSGVQFMEGVVRSTSRDSTDIDYGVILKLRDEYHPEKTILLVAGLGDIGTAGAAYYLLTHFDKLPYKQDIFGVLIEVPSGYQSARQVEFDQVARSFVIHAPQGM